MSHPYHLTATSDDADRRLYVALRAIFSTAQVAACDHKPLGWRLYATSTTDHLAMTEYENESYGGMRVRMESSKEPQGHRIVFFPGDAP